MPERAFIHKADFFQDTAGCRIIRKRPCKNAQQVCRLKQKLADLTHGLGSDALSPIGFSYIIAQICGTEVHIFFSVCGDAAGKPTIRKNGKGVNRMWVGIDERAEKGMGVIHCVGICTLRLFAMAAKDGWKPTRRSTPRLVLNKEHSTQRHHKPRFIQRR